MLTLDGRPVAATGSLLDTCRAAGVELAAFCHDARLSPGGHCRACLVEADGRCVPACTTPARAGTAVITHSPRLQAYRRDLGELMLTESQPQGSVHDQLTQWGATGTRYPTPKSAAEPSTPESAAERSTPESAAGPSTPESAAVGRRQRPPAGEREPGMAELAEEERARAGCAGERAAEPTHGWPPSPAAPNDLWGRLPKTSPERHAYAPGSPRRTHRPWHAGART